MVVEQRGRLGAVAAPKQCDTIDHNASKCVCWGEKGSIIPAVNFPLHSVFFKSNEEEETC